MDRGQDTFEPPGTKMNLKELAAIRVIQQIKDENNFYKAEDLIKDNEKAEKAVKVLTELGLLERSFLNDDSYYKIKDNKANNNTPSYSIEFELSKYKKYNLTTLESLLRQIKLLQTIRSSGEEDKLIELIDKWENVTRDVIRELYDQQQGGGIGSFKKFVTKLGIKYEDLGFDEESDDEDQDENTDYYYYNDNGNYSSNEKRIKYDD